LDGLRARHLAPPCLPPVTDTKRAQGVGEDAVALAQTIDAFDNGDDDAALLHPVLTQVAALRRLTACADAEECLARFLEASEQQEALMVLTEPDCLLLMAAAFERGNAALAQVRNPPSCPCPLSTPLTRVLRRAEHLCGDGPQRRRRQPELAPRKPQEHGAAGAVPRA